MISKISDGLLSVGANDDANDMMSELTRAVAAKMIQKLSFLRIYPASSSTVMAFTAVHSLNSHKKASQPKKQPHSKLLSLKGV